MMETVAAGEMREVVKSNSTVDIARVCVCTSSCSPEREVVAERSRRWMIFSTELMTSSYTN